MVFLLDLLLINPFAVGFSIIFLMFCDLYLTRFGFRLSLQGYQNYIEFEIYELNPRYQQMIHQNLPIPLKEILFRLILGFLIFFGLFNIFSSNGHPSSIPPLVDLSLGFILLGYFTIILRHLQNIAIFNFVNKNPESLSGHVRLTAYYSYQTSAIAMGIYGFLWLILFMLFNRLFFLGGSIFTLIFALWWHRKPRQTFPQETSILSEYNQQSAVDKEPNYCINCGVPRPNKAKYCGYCGAKQSPLELSEEQQKRTLS